VNGVVASTEIADILSAAGLSSPYISILSDEFRDRPDVKEEPIPAGVAQVAE
jgi:hypothetical protein